MILFQYTLPAVTQLQHLTSMATIQQSSQLNRQRIVILHILQMSPLAQDLQLPLLTALLKAKLTTTTIPQALLPATTHLLPTIHETVTMY